MPCDGDPSRRATTRRSLTVGLLVSVLAGLAPAVGGPFVAGGQTLYTLDPAATPLGEFPAGLKLLNGAMTVRIKDGVPMLQASSESEFLITLPASLPQDFTLEFDLVPKTCCNPEDLSFEGTPEKNRGSGSAHVVWHREILSVVGGGEYFEVIMPEDLKASTPGTLTRVVVTIEGTTMKLYTNGRELFTLTDRKFARGRVLRVFLGGYDGETVYLAGLRLMAGALPPRVLAANPAPASTISTPPAAAAGVTRIGTTTALAPPTGLTVSGTPALATLTWQAPTGWSPTGYTVARTTTGIAGSVLLTSSPIRTLRYEDRSGFTASQTITYEVTALSTDPKAFGTARTQFLVPPPENVSNVLAKANGNDVVISWMGVPGATTYLIAGSSTAMSREVPATQSAITYSGLPPGTYTWKVGARYEPGPIETPASTWPSVTIELLALPTILVGTGISDITGPIADVVMMGYADGTQKAGGLHTRLYARAYIFANPGTNKRVVWVSAELAMLFSSIKQGVLAKLAAKYGSLYTDQNVMLSATHTHSGPGGYSHHTIYNFSIGGVVQPNYDAIVGGITEAIAQAHDRLAPGNVSIVSQDLIDSTMVNRSKVAFMLNPEALAVPPADEINRNMTLLKISSSTRPIGAIAFHAVHNTSMPQYNRLVSADHKGYAAYLLEKENGSIAPFQKYGDFVAAFPNGAEGDMSPNINTTLITVFTGPSPDPFESAKIIGTREFNAAFGLFNSTQVEALGSEIDYRHKFVLMPGTPVPSSNFTNGAGLKTLCTGAYGVSFMAGTEDGRTGMLSEGMAFASNFDKTAADVARATAVAFVTALMPPLAPILGSTSAAFMAASSDQCQFPKPIILPTGFLQWSPEILPFQLFRIGSLAIVGIPGEMTMQAGRRLQDAVRAVLLPLGVQHVLLTGLANEYSGYITTPEEFVSQQYEGASTLFGRLTLDAYKEAFRDLALAMASGKEAGGGPPPGDLSAVQIQWAPKVDHDEAPIGQTIGQILRQPEQTVARGPTAQINVIYRSGNPRNDQRRNDTYFRIERDLGAGNWGLVAWDGTPETRLYWNRSAVAESGIGPGCPDPVLCYWSTIRIVWNVPADAIPGRYRIRFFGAWKNGTTNQIIPYEGTSNVFTVQ